jgi:hypothetical protein
MGGKPLKTEFPPLLPAGFWPITVAHLRQRCVTAFPASVTRRGVMEGIERLIAALSAAGIVGELWIDGSFATEKIDAADADVLLRVSSDIYDRDPAKRAVIDWATDEGRYLDHSCDSYRWIEYQAGHPSYATSESDRGYWTNWFGKSRNGVLKGIIVIELPA